MSGSLDLLWCVDGVDLPARAESEAPHGVMMRRGAVRREHLCLSGRRMDAAFGEWAALFVGVGVGDEPVPEPLDRPVLLAAEDGRFEWDDDDWQERAYRTLTGETPSQARWFPLGLVPLLVLGSDSALSYAAVRVVPDGAGARWTELRRVDVGDRALVGGTVGEPRVGPNLLAETVHWSGAELAAAMGRLAHAASEQLPVGVPGVPQATPAARSWLRGWDSELHSHARSRGALPGWDPRNALALENALGAADPLRLGVAGQLVDGHSYRGVCADLSALPFSVVLAGGVDLLADYFAQVWGRVADRTALDDALEAVEGVPWRTATWGEAPLPPVGADVRSHAGGWRRLLRGRRERRAGR